MDRMFDSLKGLLKIDTYHIDNNVFRLHYKVTVAILIAFSILVTSRQYIGDPINCVIPSSLSTNWLDNFCWVQSTYSISDAWKKKVGEEVPYPGVDQTKKGNKKIYHAYYQWVCFVLFLQAILFYIPRYLWKMWEGNRVRTLVMDLNSPVLSESRKRECRSMVIKYLIDSFHHHGMYAFGFFVCEILNLANVLGQMYLMDVFLGGEFMLYGFKVISFTEWDWSVRFDPMMKVFPRVTKCLYRRYGPSGDVENQDTICVLSINVINEKIYIILWFWFIILFILSVLTLMYRVVIFSSSKLRLFILKKRARVTNAKNLKAILNHTKMSDWFLLDLLCKNMDPLNYRDMIDDLAKMMGLSRNEDYYTIE